MQEKDWQDILSSFINRAYPAWLTLDIDVWKMVNSSIEGINLYLSDEENQILQEIHDVPTASLPAFIGGGAGSGKTTMLVYIFSYYCQKSLQLNGEEEYPIFLTYGNKLLHEIKTLVRYTLTDHSRHLKKLSDEKLSLMERSFHTFTNFLLSFLSQQEIDDSFPKEGRISFSLFKALYSHNGINYLQEFERNRPVPPPCNLPNRKRWSPELAWFLIRSVIQGASEDFYITPEDFQEDPALAGGAVTHTDFKIFYESIWDQWYKNILKDEIPWQGRNVHFWDDQSLVRYLLRKILNNELNIKYFPAIFCDEAQDFTPVELRLILQFFSFRYYNLSKTTLCCLPLAFAGDVHQTLYPTGFSWERLKSLYYEEILGDNAFGRVFGKEQINQFKPTEKNFKRLETNYRSSGPITRFLNSIQLYRRVILRQQDIKPQKPRNPEFGLRPLYIILENIEKMDKKAKKIYLKDLSDKLSNMSIIINCEEDEKERYISEDNILEDNILKDKKEKEIYLEYIKYLKDKLGNMSIIINCEEDEKERYISEDNILKELFFDQGEINRKFNNILTPFEAKGLNLPKVIVWKFGETMFLDNQADSLSQLYFFNRLYVSASRSTEELYIIDTPRGVERLWKNFEEGNLNELMSQLGNDRWRREDILDIREGGLEDLREYTESQWAERAKSYLELAKHAEFPENIHLAEKAKDNYIKIMNRYPGQTSRYKKEISYCEAWIEYFKGNYRSAGKKFYELGCYQEAFNSYWKGCLWKELWQMLEKWPSEGLETRGIDYREIIPYMNQQGDLNHGWNLLQKEINRLQKVGLRLSEEPQILDLVKEFCIHVERKIQSLSYEILQAIAEFLENKIFKLLEYKISLLSKQDAYPREIAKSQNLISTVGLCYFYLQNWEKCVLYLEMASATHLPQYVQAKHNLALQKAKAKGLPEGLKSLSPLRDFAQDILDIWAEQGKPQSSNWYDLLGEVYESLASSLFFMGDFKENGSLFIDKLKKSNDSLSLFVKNKLSSKTQQKLNQNEQIGEESLVKEMNEIIKVESIYDKDRFENIKLSNETKQLLDQNHTGDKLIQLNRLLLEDAYPQEIAKSQSLENFENSIFYFIESGNITRAKNLLPKILESKRLSFLQNILKKQLQLKKEIDFVKTCREYFDNIKQDERTSFASWLAELIADSSLEPNNFRDAGENKELEDLQEIFTKFLEENFINNLKVDETTLTFVKVAQTALEKVGRIQATLRLSKRFSNASSAEIRQWIRERHLVALKRDERYWEERLKKAEEDARKKEANDRIERAQNDYNHFSKEWKIFPDIDFLSKGKVSGREIPNDFRREILEIDVNNRRPVDVKELMCRHAEVLKNIYDIDIYSLLPIDASIQAERIQKKLQESKK
ncbi:MAG: hypothetical protein HUU50_12485 [Candidatus Brocadiae bacterium]|nr:hypothetical protein [Candidatus Brocadiia bacterium]